MADAGFAEAGFAEAGFADMGGVACGGTDGGSTGGGGEGGGWIRERRGCDQVGGGWLGCWFAYGSGCASSSSYGVRFGYGSLGC
jgi:hypothetical protein